MRGKSLALLVLALGCGLVASIGITRVLAKRGPDNQQAGVETEPIFVALENIGLGDPLNSQMLKIEQWPKDKIPEDALTKIEDIEGRRVRTRLFAGEPILERKLLKKGESSGGVSPLIPKGMRVVSVKVDAVSSGGGLVLPGDRVDVAVFLTENCRKGIPETATRTVLQDIKVFAVNDIHSFNAEDSDRASIEASTVSLLVTPSQAHLLMLASEMGKIRLVLRPPDDESQSDDTSARYADILDPEARDRQQETLMEPEEGPKQGDEMDGFMSFLNKQMQSANTPQSQTGATQQAAATPQMPNGSVQPDNVTWNMRIIRAGDVEDVTLEKSADPLAGSTTWRHGGMGSGTPAATGGGVTPDGYAPFTGAPPADDPATGDDTADEEEDPDYEPEEQE